MGDREGRGWGIETEREGGGIERGERVGDREGTEGGGVERGEREGG